MLVLHASLGPDEHVLVWAESSSGDGQVRHVAPRAALGGIGEPLDVALALPTRAGRALPSPELARLAASLAGSSDGEAPVTLEPVEVSGVRIAPGELLDVLVTWDREVQPGVVLGTDLSALRELARHAAAIVLRQEYVPDVRFVAGQGEQQLVACWSPLPRADARDALEEAIAGLPEVLGAWLHEEAAHVRQPVAVRARRLVAALVDELVRSRIAADPPRLVATTPARAEAMHDRWLRALTTADGVIEGPPDALDRLAADVSDWQQRLRRRSESPWRLLLRLEEPVEPRGLDDDADVPAWSLRYLVQLRADATVVVPAASAWQPKGSDRRVLEAHGFHPGEHLLEPLAEAAQHVEAIAESLAAPRPTGCELDADGALAFLRDASSTMEQLGIAVSVPAWWTNGRGRAPVSLRARVTELDGGRQHMDALNLATLVGYDWRAAVGDVELGREELVELAVQKSDLVRLRGRWVQLDRRALRVAIAHLDRVAAGAQPVATVAELARMSVGATPGADGLPVSGVSAGEGDIAELLARVARREAPRDVAVPAGLEAHLRSYQLRGFRWLVAMAELGLGACLADDMGLGKTVQVLAAIQHAWEQTAPEHRRPTLVVCPTSVLTTWRREAERFTPSLPTLVHHGADRDRDGDFAKRAIVFTSYGLLARDAEQLRATAWRAVVLDEAQNIKNPGTAHARAARSIGAPVRVALTGTPVENHAGDLWSLMEFCNPGLLGSQADFRRKYLIPIQTGTFPDAAQRLRQVVAPFVLRREKTDRDVIADLPDKLEQVTYCRLTTEQASLYEAVVRDAAEVLRMPRDQARRSGIERRGLILATISRLKQACNHPAQLLADNSRIAGRSGKLQRLEQLVEQVLDRGERALVFTQFVAMGDLLRRHLADVFDREVLFLHGGTSRRERDGIVERFQGGGSDAPPLLVLSLKAGGSGLNLTAASHVIHYDRWWNPATEQQATDRAFRIGQTRDVQVHALVCAGTVEERIDLMLRQKRGVADTLVGGGEHWITELDDEQLLDLLALRRDTMLQETRLDDIDAKEWMRVSL